MFNRDFFSINADNDKRPDSVSLDCKENDLDNKHRNSIEIKQERFNDASLCPDDDLHSLSTTQPPLKKLRADVADAESNTTNSGKSRTFNFPFLFACYILSMKNQKNRWITGIIAVLICPAGKVDKLRWKFQKIFLS